MQSLYETVKEILDTGRVGFPVFVRCTVHVDSEEEDVEHTLARVLAMVCSWMKAAPLRVYAQSRDVSRQITVTVQYIGGQTSIVSVSATSGADNRLDLILLGSKGALYHDAEAMPPGFDITAEPVSIQEWLLHAVYQSLRSSKPALIEEVTDVA